MILFLLLGWALTIILAIFIFKHQYKIIINKYQEIEECREYLSTAQEKVRWESQKYENLTTREAQSLFAKWKVEYEQEIRQDAVNRSRAITIGKITEHVTPYLPDFRFNPKDARFIGSPIDFIIFDGLDEGKIKKVIFVEVKTGESNLSNREKQIKEAINNNQIGWEEIRIKE